MIDSLISVDSVSFGYKQKEVLKNVSFKIDVGEVVTIVGVNGAGKTTLAKLILGLLKPTSGIISLNNKIKMAYVPQVLSYNQSVPLSVFDYIKLSKPKASYDKICHIIRRVGLDAKVQYDSLSGGQKQRASIARSIISSANFIVMDEPLANIDLLSQVIIYELLLDLVNIEKVSLLLISHDLNVVLSISNRVICIDGRILCQGSPKDVRNDKAWRNLFGDDKATMFNLYSHNHNI